MAEYPDDPNGMALAGLAADGVDMTQPILIEFTVDAPDEPAATAIEKGLEEAGYTTEIYFDEGELEADDAADLFDEFGPSWTVYVKQTMIPEYAEVVRIQSDLDRIAADHGGIADGWGAAIQ